MTAFPSSSPPLAAPAGVSAGAAFNSREKIESLVKRTRQKQVPAEVEQRAVPRKSIAELEATDFDTIREQLQSSRLDDRGPVVKFLDLLDSGRNQILSTLAPGLERRARERGDVATGGTGRVNFSDVLGEMGMEPGFVRSAVGLVGDIALDPLTYVGGVGIGAKIATKGGRAVNVGRGGVRALKSAEKAGASAIPEVQALIDATGGASGLRKAVLGTPDAPAGLRAKAGRAFSETLKGKPTQQSGLIHDYADAYSLASDANRAVLDGKMKAVDDFIKKYGHGAGPTAIKIGKDASGKLRFQIGAGRGNEAIRGATQSLFHVPFTDISLLSVPAFGPLSKASAVGLRRAAEGATRQGVVAASSPKTREVSQIVDQFESLVKKRGERWSSELKLRQENPEAIARMYPNGIETDEIFEATLLDSTNPDAAIHASIQSNIKANAADDKMLGELRDRLQVRLAEVDEAPQAFSVGEILALQEQVRRLDAVAGAHLSKIGSNAEHIRLRNSLLASEAERIRLTTDATTRLSAIDEAMAVGGKGSPFSVRPFLGFDPATGGTVINADQDVIGQVSTRIAHTKRESGMSLLDEYEDALDDLEKAERKGDATISQTAGGLDKAALRKRADSLRDELYAATAPLREGQAKTTLEDFAETVRAQDRAALRQSNEIMADLIEMPDAEARAFDDMTRVASEGVAAALAASWATKASAIAFMSPEQIRLLELQKDFLGTADSIVGASTIAGIRSVGEGLFRSDSKAVMSIRERLDRAMANASASYRRYLGGPRGELADAVRHAVYMASDGGRRAAAERMAGMFKDMRGIAAKHGLAGKEDQLLSLATALHIKMNLGGDTVWRMKDVDGNITGFAKHLERVAKNGWLTPDHSSALEQDLIAFARSNDLLTPIREIEAAEGVLGLGQIRKDYFTNTPTATAQKFIARAKGASLEPSQAVQKAIAAGQEAFQKPRSLDSAIFDSTALGRKVEVFEGDRWTQTMSPQEIEGIVDPQRRKFVEETKAALDEYDRMPKRPPMQQNDPFRVNELKDRLRALWGTDDIPGGMMDTNYATVLGARYYAHERALATKLFEREVLPAASLPIGVREMSELASVPHGTEVRLKNGMVAKLVQLGSGASGPNSRVYSGPAVQVGDDIFRPLAPGVRNVGNNPLIDALGDSGKGALYHQHVAEAIESAASLFTDDGYGFWKNVDKLTGHWKRITLLHPSWWMSNVIGESINYTGQDTGFPAALGKYSKAVAQMFRVARDPEALAKIKVGVMGSDTTGREIMDMVRDTPIVGSAMFQEASSRAMRNDTLMHSRMGGAGAALGKAAIAGDYEQMIAKNMATGDGPILSAIKSGAAVAGDRVNRYLFEPWTRTNAVTSDMLRTVAYLSLRDQGWAHGEAVRRVVRAGFDYQDLTPWEKEWGRRFFPFWAWLKNNSIYQAKMLMERPMFVGSLPVLQHAIEEAVNGEDTIPIAQRPKWMQEGMAIQIGGEDRGRVGLIVGNFLPQEQALLFGRFASGAEGVQSAANYIASSLNPVVRAPLEIGAGREFFSDRTIGGDATLNDLSIGGHLANQIRPLREIPKLASTVRDQGPLAGGLRAALGGRVQPMTDDRIQMSNEREFRDREERLRIALRRADRQGDVSARTAANLQLMLLYKSALERGMEASVPRWARERLSTLTAKE